MNEPTALGFAHFIAQSDAVGKALLGILLLMSAISWGLIAVKGLAQWLRTQRSEKFLNFFWNARSLDEVSGEIATHGAHEPFAHLTAHAMNAQVHHAKYGAAKLAEAGTDKSRLLSATVYITDMALKPQMKEDWEHWVDMDNPPQRACIGATLEHPHMVEIVCVAATKD
mgnify:CR=1 FL=1